MSADVVFANFDSVLGAPDKDQDSTAISRRAAAVAPACRAIIGFDQPVIGPGADTLPDWIPVGRRSGDLCMDFLEDDAAQRDLQTVVSDHARPPSIWAQVYSPSMDTLSRELDRWGVDRTLLPDCSGVTVAYWNSKAGGSELLRSAVGECHPISIACRDTSHLRDVLGEAAPGSWFVKPDRALGGLGIAIVEAGTEWDAVQDALEFHDAQSDAKPKPKPRMLGGALLAQRVVGVPSTNTSPTIDVWISPSEVSILSVVDQVLADQVRYVGCRSVSQQTFRSLRDIREQALLVGELLRSEGYRGLANIDFVVTTSGDTAVIELNLRQSAPLDQTLTIRRVFGAESEDDVSWIALEAGLDDDDDQDDVIRYGGGATLAIRVDSRTRR